MSKAGEENVTVVMTVMYIYSTTVHHCDYVVHTYIWDKLLSAVLEGFSSI